MSTRQLGTLTHLPNPPFNNRFFRSVFIPYFFDKRARERVRFFPFLRLKIPHKPWAQWLRVVSSLHLPGIHFLFCSNLMRAKPEHRFDHRLDVEALRGDVVCSSQLDHPPPYLSI